MPERTLPGLGLTGDYDLGQTGWKVGMDLNLLTISVILGGSALSLVSADPGSPTAGDIHLLDDTHPTNAGEVSVYDEAAWVYIAVAVGTIMYDVGGAQHRYFNGTTWVAL